LRKKKKRREERGWKKRPPILKISVPERRTLDHGGDKGQTRAASRLRKGFHFKESSIISENRRVQHKRKKFSLRVEKKKESSRKAPHSIYSQGRLRPWARKLQRKKRTCRIEAHLRSGKLSTKKGKTLSQRLAGGTPGVTEEKGGREDTKSRSTAAGKNPTGAQRKDAFFTCSRKKD